jgi:hypothetical protein
VAVVLPEDSSWERRRNAKQEGNRCSHEMDIHLRGDFEKAQRSQKLFVATSSFA